MEFIRPLKIPIFFFTEEGQKIRQEAIKEGKDYFIDECTSVEDMFFYTINAVNKYKEDGAEYSLVRSNGESYTTMVPIEKLVEVLNRHIDKWGVHNIKFPPLESE